MRFVFSIVRLIINPMRERSRLRTARMAEQQPVGIRDKLERVDPRDEAEDEAVMMYLMWVHCVAALAASIS